MIVRLCVRKNGMHNVAINLHDVRGEILLSNAFYQICIHNLHQKCRRYWQTSLCCQYKYMQPKYLICSFDDVVGVRASILCQRSDGNYPWSNCAGEYCVKHCSIYPNVLFFYAISRCYVILLRLARESGQLRVYFLFFCVSNVLLCPVYVLCLYFLHATTLW